MTTTNNLPQERELTDFEKAVLAEFNEEPKADEEEVEDGEEEQPPPEGDEPEGDDGAEDEEEPATDDEEQPPPEDHLEDVFDFNGRELREEELRKAIELNDYFNSLPDEAVTAVNALLSGDYVLVHRDQVGQLQQEQKPPVAAPPVDDEEPIDPQAHARIQHLEQTLAQQEEFRKQQERAEAARMQEQTLELLRLGRNTFAESHKDLTQDEIQGLWATVVKTGSMTPTLVQSHNGDVAAAMETALEQAYWGNETYRQKEVQKALEREREAATDKRKRRGASSALASRGGNVPRTTAAPRTRDEKLAAMAGELHAHMTGGQE